MNTFKAYMKKEIIESKRQFKYIVLGFGFLLFSITSPLTLKLLPKMMEGQIKGDINAIFHIRGVDGFNQYLQNNVFQMCILIITLGLMNIIAGEYKDKKLTFPSSKGASITQIILAKAIHYTAVVVLFLWVSVFINVYYTQILFPHVRISSGVIIKSGLFVTLYITFIIAMIICFSFFTRKGIASAVIVLIINFFSPIFSSVKFVKHFLPYNLIKYTGTDYPNFNKQQKILVAAVLSYIVVMYIVAVIKARRVEII